MCTQFLKDCVFTNALFLKYILLCCLLSFSACQQPAIVSVRLCNEAYEKSVCVANQESFDQQAPAIYLSCRFINPPQTGEVSIAYYFLGETPPRLIQENKIGVGKTNSGHAFNYFSKLNQPASGWTEGPYQLSIKSHYGNLPIIEKQFTIKANL